MEKFRKVCVCLALVLCLLCSGVTAQAGMMLDGVPSAHEAYALNAAYQASGWLIAADSSGTLVSHASAVLIDPYWILFSGHQLYGKTYSTVDFGLGSNMFINPGETRTVTVTYIYPDDAGDVGGSTNDIALGYPVNPILDVAPRNAPPGLSGWRLMSLSSDMVHREPPAAALENSMALDWAVKTALIASVTTYLELEPTMCSPISAPCVQCRPPLCRSSSA